MSNDEWFKPYNAPTSEVESKTEETAPVDHEDEETAPVDHEDEETPSDYQGGGITLVHVVMGIIVIGMAAGFALFFISVS